MDKYYYLASQLPLLFFGQQPPTTRESFLEEAQKWLSPKDLAVITNISIDDFVPHSSDPAVVREYKMFERQVRNDILLWRKARTQQTGYSSSVVPSSLLREGNPLDVERKLLQLRWEFIAEKAREHYFDVEFLVLYLLQLHILQRLTTFNKEKGMEKFRQVCEVTHE